MGKYDDQKRADDRAVRDRVWDEGCIETLASNTEGVEPSALADDINIALRQRPAVGIVVPLISVDRKRRISY